MRNRSLAVLLVAFLIAPFQILAQDKTKIGFVIPLSGEMAFVGDDIRKGVELALSEDQELSSRLQVAYEDNQFELSKSASAAHKLISTDKSNILVSLWDGADVVAPIAEKEQKLHIAIRWDPEIAQSYTSTIMFESPYMFYADKELEIAGKLKAKNIAIIESAHKSQRLIFDYLASKFKEKDIKLIERITITEGYKGDKSLLYKLLNKKPDLIFLHLFMPDLYLIARDLVSLNAADKVSGYFDVLPPNTIQDKIVLPFAVSMNFKSTFIKKFEARYSSLPIIRSPLSYDLIRILGGITKDKVGFEINPEDFNSIQNFQGESGSISYHPKGKLFFDSSINIFKEGRISNYSY